MLPSTLSLFIVSIHAANETNTSAQSPQLITEQFQQKLEKC